jgi:hypothetical protein
VRKRYKYTYIYLKILSTFKEKMNVKVEILVNVCPNYMGVALRSHPPTHQVEVK